MDQRFYVIAGRRDQALYLARIWQIPLTNVRYVSATRDLRGIKGEGGPIYVYGTYWANPEHREIIAMAKERGFQVEFTEGSKKPNIALDTLDKSVQD